MFFCPKQSPSCVGDCFVAKSKYAPRNDGIVGDFYALKRIYQNSIVEIEEIIGAAGDPKKITERALKKPKEIRQRKRDDKSVDRDQVWAVFDRDEHVWFEDSIRRCGEQGVKVGYANPCFELWILLHQNSCHNSGDDRHQLQKKCAAFLPGYDPRGSKTGNFEDICQYVEVAEKHADWLTKQREIEANPRGRPSTSIHLLTRVIRGEIHS